MQAFEGTVDARFKKNISNMETNLSSWTTGRSMSQGV